MIGCFKPKVREHWRSLCITTDNNEAFFHFVDKPDSFITHFQAQEKTFYEVFEKLSTSYEETEAPIYNMILEMEAIELHKMSIAIKHKGGIVLDLSTDCISCVFPGEFPFKLDENHIIVFL